MPTYAGEQLLAGRYRVERILGSGGMASVLLCEDVRLGRRVAVKRLHVHSPEDTARRFVREARLGAALNHPNLVTVLDSVADAEAVLIVMEYVPGESLDLALRRGPLEPERVVSIVGDIAAALDHAHSHGVVHRDVKPGNVLLRDDGSARLVDLGIATAADITRITRSGVLLGTAAYMAPEQLEGDEAGPASDIYSLAAVAFEAFTGRKARPGRSPLEVAHRIATEPPPDVRDHWPRAPKALAAALKDGMARDPEARPRSAGALADRIQAATAPPATGGPLPLPSPRRRGPRRTAGRGAASFAAAALAAVALAVGAVALLTGGDDSSKRASGSGGGAKQEKRSAGKSSKQPAAPATPTAPVREAPAPQPSTPPTSGGSGSATSGSGGAAEGARLNQQGYALVRAGRYREAIPVLQRAVAAFPQGTTDLNFAYALYNLGRSLRLVGRPAEAIPILERRLKIPNQTDVVRSELEAAKRDAGR